MILPGGERWWWSLSSGVRHKLEAAAFAERHSCVVSGAKPDRREFWRMVEARRAPRLRLVTEATR